MDNNILFPPYASLGHRIIAFVLDLLILLVPCALANRFAPGWGGILILFLYAPIFEASELKATVGKYIVGIQVVDITGKGSSLWQALLRNVLKFISSFLLFIGFFFACFTQRKQALHDLFANTVVVYGKKERPILKAWIDTVRHPFREKHKDF